MRVVYRENSSYNALVGISRVQFNLDAGSGSRLPIVKLEAMVGATRISRLQLTLDDHVPFFVPPRIVYGLVDCL